MLVQSYNMTHGCQTLETILRSCMDTNFPRPLMAQSSKNSVLIFKTPALGLISSIAVSLLASRLCRLSHLETLTMPGATILCVVPCTFSWRTFAPR